MDTTTVRVEVKVVIIPSVELPVSLNDEIYLVEYVVGTFVQ